MTSPLTLRQPEPHISQNGYDPEDDGPIPQADRDFLLKELNPPAVGRAATDALRQTAAEAEQAAKDARDALMVVVHKANESWVDLPKRAMRVGGLIGAGDVVMLFGPPGGGKTWVCLDMGVCISVGIPWLQRVTDGTPVLVIDEESGLRRLLTRLAKTMRGHGIAPGSDPPIHFTTLAGFDFYQGTKWFGILKDLILRTGAGLVWIDSLITVMPGGDDNWAKETQPIFRGLRVIAEETGAAIIVIHHANKAGNYRGSTAILGAVDLALKVTQDSGKLIKIETTKTRDIEPLAIGCRGSWDDTTQSFALHQVELRPAGKQLGAPQRYVLRFLAAHPEGASRDEIADGAEPHCRPSSALKALTAMVEEKLIVRLDSGGRGTKATIGLTDKGRQVAETVS